MKRLFAVLLVLAVVLSAFSLTALAAEKKETGTVNRGGTVSRTQAPDYYDVDGNLVVIDGLYYDEQGYPCFNGGCYYLDGDANPVYVGGCRAYCYNDGGDLVFGRYCYDSRGNIVENPAGQAAPRYGRGGGCCGGGRGGSWR